MRNILTVTRAMLAVIPENQKKFQQQLWSIRDIYLYTPPEAQQPGWYDLTKCVNENIKLPFNNLKEWEKQVINILEDRYE